MKKFTLLLAAVMLSVVSFAIDFTLSSNQAVTQDGVTVTFAKGSGSNAPTWYDAGLRLYAKNTITITSTDNITGVVFNWEKQGSKDFAGATANVGDYSHPTTAGTGTWSAEAGEGVNTVVITLGNSGQLQLNTFSVVTVTPATLSAIAVSGTPNKTEYFAGETFNPAGLVVTGTYSDASTKEITEGIEWLVDPETLIIGTTSVDVLATVKGANNTDITSDVYAVNVTVTAPKELASLSVSGTPAEFWKGDTFNHDGMTVTATWSDETTTDVTDEATFSEPDMTTAGEKTVTVTYKEKTTTYTIEVKTIANTQETAYTVAEAIALIDAGKDLSAEVYVAGIVSGIPYAWNSQNNTITYNISDDGTTTAAQLQLYKCATDGATVYDRVIAKGVLYKYNSNYQLNAGNTLVSIETPVVSAIAISGEATKTAYFAGQTFNPAGLVVTATYDDETTADVTALVEWVITPAVLEETTTSVSVSATYKEISATAVVVDVTVSEAPKTVTIDLTQDETTEASTDKLEWKGTIVTVTADKAGAGTNANNYYPGTEGKSYTSTRFYTNSTLTFAPANGITIKSIEYEATSEAYTTAMTNSAWTNATAASGGMIVTITPTDGTKAVSATIGATTGGKSFVVYYSGESTATVNSNATVAEKAVKVIENGQLVIICEGVKYNAQGVRL